MLCATLSFPFTSTGTPPSATLEGGSNSSSSSSTSQTDAAAAAGTTSRALQQQLSELALSSAGPSSRDAATTASDPLHQQQQHLPPHQQPHQQQHRPERLPRCSTVSLQTELATPSLVVFSGGTAFNSVAGGCGSKMTQAVSYVWCAYAVSVYTPGVFLVYLCVPDVSGCVPELPPCCWRSVCTQPNVSSRRL